MQTTTGLTPATARSDEEGGTVDEEVPAAETGGSGSQGEFTIAQGDSIETILDRLSLSQHLQLFQVQCTLSIEHTPHVHTHLHTCTCTCIYHCQNWLRGPHSGGEPAGGNKTGGPIGSGDTRLISTSAWPPQCIGVLIYGLARPMRCGRWSTALSDSIRISVLDSWPQYSPHTLGNF